MTRPKHYLTVPVDAVEAALKSAGNKFITVTFVKLNGQLRTYNGQLRATSRLAGTERGIKQGAAMKKRGQVWIALPNGESKSFYKDRVLSIHAGHKVISTENFLLPRD